MPRPQSVDPGHILDCAADLFEQRGYEGVTTQAVARAAGVSEGALFRYFSSKEQLFTAALMVRAGAPGYFAALQGLIATAEAPPPLAAALEQVSRSALAFYRKAVRAITVLAARQGSFPPAPAHLHEHGERPGPAAAHRIVSEYLRRLQARNEVRPGDPEARAAHLLDGLFGYAFTAAMLAGSGGEDSSWLPEAEAFRRQFVEDFVNGVAAPTGAAEERFTPHSATDAS